MIKVWITKPENKVLNAFSKFDEKFSRDNAAALKHTTLKPKNKPDINPIRVVLEKKLLKNNFKSLIVIIITPNVAIIIPVIPKIFSLSFSIIYSNIATCITSVLLKEVPTTKFENLKRYSKTKVNIIWNIDAKIT